MLSYGLSHVTRLLHGVVFGVAVKLLPCAGWDDGHDVVGGSECCHDVF